MGAHRVNASFTALAAATALLAAPSPCAAAEPICGGEPPTVGTTVKGPILHILDGRTVCVARTSDPRTWVALKVVQADPTSDLARRRLASVAFAQDAICTVTSVHRGAEARCTVAAIPLEREVVTSATIARASLWR